MAGRHLLRTAIVTAVAILSLTAASTAALAAPDRTPPSAPRIIYLHSYCLNVIVGVDRSTDNRTPQSQLTYDVFADGRRIGSMADLGHGSGVYSIQRLTTPAPTPSPSRRSTQPATGPHPALAPARPTS